MNFFEKLASKIPVNVERCRREAESGDVKAQFALGGLYERGQGVPQNYHESARWYRKAAEQGHCGAQLYLGIYLAQGSGVERDFVEAYRWLECAKRGSALDRASATECQNNLIKHMSSEQLSEAQNH